MSCSCPVAGYCPAFGKIQQPRHWQICRGEVLTPEACDAYRADWMVIALNNGHDPLSCTHRGQVVDQRTQKVESKNCNTCASRGTAIPVYTCALHGRCTLQPWQFGQVEAACSTCSDRKELRPTVTGRRRIEPSQLLPSEYQFNNSIIRYKGKLLMAYRVHWDNARIAVAELDDNYQVKQNSWLVFKLGMAQEDPRLFVFRDELYCSFSAVYQTRDRFWTDVCYGKVEQGSGGYWYAGDEYAPQYKGRNLWEKNWGFFEYENELHCVYSIKPHKVLKVTEDRCETVAETTCEFPNKPGLLHGGAPPMFHRGEYYSFYHRRMGASKDKFYTLDVYTFEAKPPFRPSRHVELDLLRPDVKDRPAAHVPHAMFPGGAFIDRHDWVISFGYYDKWSEVVHLGINDLERCLVALGKGPCDGVAYRRGTNDLAFWKEVHDWNDYGLPDAFSVDDVVIDIGAHIGSFTRACLDRGVGYVIAVEPFAHSYLLLERNCAYYANRVDLLQLAVGGEVGRMAIANPDPSGHSHVAVGGYASGPVIGEVDLVPLSYIVPAGRVRLLKVDAEGAEYDIFANADLDKIDEIVGEAHRIKWRGIDADMTVLARMFEAQGFAVTSKEVSRNAWVFRAVRVP
jgi:FkbM family methyltransferase